LSGDLCECDVKIVRIGKSQASPTQIFSIYFYSDKKIDKGEKINFFTYVNKFSHMPCREAKAINHIIGHARF